MVTLGLTGQRSAGEQGRTVDRQVAIQQAANVLGEYVCETAPKIDPLAGSRKHLI